MQKDLIPFDHFEHQFSERDIDYTHHSGLFKDFFAYPPEYNAFSKAIEDRLDRNYPRDLLVKTLLDQYKSLDILSPTQREAISIIAEPTTFTITTAHQPCLFTGPLYVLYKAASTIQLARALSQRYNQYQFVPFFVVGGEDHDFEEMNHAQIFGKEVIWKRDQVGGPVGRMNMSSLSDAMDHLKDILGDSPNAQQTYRLIEEAYDGAKQFGDATARLLHALFGQYGLLFLQMDDAGLKEAFKPIMREELFESVSKPLVEKQQGELQQNGYTPQAHARAVNFFLFNAHGRDRIERLDEHYFHLVESDTKMSREQLGSILEESPERISPNVIVRPLYQEYILPNLAYVGGGGELAYWLERKTQFKYFDIPYPVLVRRNSVLWVDKRSANTLNEAGFSLEDIAGDYEPKLKQYAAELTDEETSLSEEKSSIHKIYRHIAEKAKTLEPTLEKAVKAEQTRQMKALDHLEDKLLRVAKHKNDQDVNRVRKAAEQLFPGRELQERTDNFLNFYINDPEIITQFIDNFDPFDFRFHILIEFDEDEQE